MDDCPQKERYEKRELVFTSGEVTLSKLNAANEPVSVVITDAAGREVNRMDNI